MHLEVELEEVREVGRVQKVEISLHLHEPRELVYYEELLPLDRLGVLIWLRPLVKCTNQLGFEIKHEGGVLTKKNELVTHLLRLANLILLLQLNVRPAQPKSEIKELFKLLALAELHFAVSILVKPQRKYLEFEIDKVVHID